MQSILEEKETLSHEHQDLMKKKAKLELTIKDIMEDIEGEKKLKVSWMKFEGDLAVVSTKLNDRLETASVTCNTV